MTIVFIAILIFSYLLVATEHITKVNKAAAVIFAGAVGWVLFVCWGGDFVPYRSSIEIKDFFNGAVATSSFVKEYIVQDIFLKYVGKASEIAIFLLSTMSIVGILSDNGCFNYIKEILHIKSSKKMLWLLSIITFILSANLGNLTSTIMMLIIMQCLVANKAQKIILGSAIVISANAGGALTVIGAPTGLLLWSMGAITASNYSLSLAIPCILAFSVPVYLLSRMLPEHIDLETDLSYYNDEDTNISAWQKILLLFVGIGGLWFIPTFTSITKLSPFLGAMCVLAVLWMINEMLNRKTIRVTKMVKSKVPRILEYNTIQMILFVFGIMLAMGVVKETGAVAWLAHILDKEIHNVWLSGIAAGLISGVLDNFATAMTLISFHDVSFSSLPDGSYLNNFAQNGDYWKIIAYNSAIGGNLLLTGSMSGLALLKLEDVRPIWFFRHVGGKTLLGWIVGFIALYFIL